MLLPLCSVIRLYDTSAVLTGLTLPWTASEAQFEFVSTQGTSKVSPSPGRELCSVSAPQGIAQEPCPPLCCVKESAEQCNLLGNVLPALDQERAMPWLNDLPEVTQ